MAFKFSIGGSGGPGLSASKSTYYTTIAQGALIAALTDPFGAGSTYTVVGSAPAQLALASDGRIVAGMGAQAVGQAYTIVVRATKGQRAVEEPLTFTAIADPLETPVTDAQRYMFWSTRSRFPSGSLVTAASATNYVMTRIVLASTVHTVTNPRFHFSGFASTEGGNSPQETVLPGNATVIDGVWISVNGAAPVALTFGGQAGVSIASGNIGAWTDEPTITVPREASVAIYTLYHTAAAEKQIPVYRIQTARGERVWGATDAATLTPMLSAPATASTASLDTGFGQSQPAYYGPDMTVARGWDGRPVVLGVVDSIGEARQEYAAEADTRGNLGWLRRWLDKDDPSYRRVPFMMMGMPGAGSARELGTNATLRWQVLDQAAAFNASSALPFTVAVNQLGQNDSNSTYSTMQGNWTGFVDRFKTRYPGMRMIATGVLPRTTSTNFWTTREGQTASQYNEWASTTNGWGNGFKWQLEAFKEAGGGGRLAGYISTKPYWYDAGAPGTWPIVADTYTLAAQAGTDGTTPYTSFQTTTPPRIADILIGGGAALSVLSVTGTGPYTVTTSSNTAVVPSGTVMRPQVSPEGVHPFPSAVQAIVAAIPQSQKALLAP
ncbi:SGNH/GDSL hydrolase family protein [Sphingomonas sp. GM_Shp_1]|uniref:SGNH/GDSL hydrolase family protein n=1 Tax=Sphingomonas sp. GM_Shp_1 TaxID=2937381 RepID=UPI00226B824F|nr:SGNH/GDSL hydrolase family protein [Sphingomonas sp. GM_Shp_1]